MKYKKTFILSVFLFILLFSNFSINGVSVPNVNYTFNRNILLDSDTSTFDQEFNFRQVSVYQGHYNDSFGFYNQSIGVNQTNINFIDGVGSTYYTQISDVWDGHKNIITVEADDPSVFGEAPFASFSQTSGIIDFWITASTDTLTFISGGGTSLVSVFYISSIDTIRVLYGDGGGGVIAVNTLIRDFAWAHISVFFDCNTDKFSMWVNGSLVVNDENFQFDSTAIVADKISLTVNDGEIGYYSGITYSWINPLQFESMLPILETHPLLKQVNKAEFALKDANTFTESSDSNLDGFSKVILSDGRVDPIVDTSDVNDRVLSIFVKDGGDVAGIVKDDLGLTGMNFIHASVEATVQEHEGNGGVFDVAIRSLDDTRVGGFKFDMTTYPLIEIGVWTLGWSIIAESIDFRYNINIEHHIDYELEIQITDLYLNSTFKNRTVNPLAVKGKSGFNKIEVDLSQSGFAGSVNLDSLGVYVQANPITEGLGWGVISIGKEWNFRIHNLFTKKIGIIEGLIHLGSASGYYQVEHFPNTFAEITPFQDYNNISTFENVYDKTIESNGYITDNASFIFTVNGSLFSVSEFLIEGVILNEGSNEYSLLFTHNNVSINDNYFFVDNNHRLRFIHTTIENDTTEFIQGIFNINDFSTNDFGLSFRSQIDNKAIGNFSINYPTDSDTFQLSITSSTQRKELTQGLNAQLFTILISDNNITGITNGFISHITFLPLTNVVNTLLIFSLLTMLIPIIIILIPTIALRELYGSSFVIPIFLLMSFILFLGGLIPIWLIFIIMVSSSLFIIKQNRQSIFE